MRRAACADAVPFAAGGALELRSFAEGVDGDCKPELGIATWEGGNNVIIRRH